MSFSIDVFGRGLELGTMLQKSQSIPGCMVYLEAARSSFRPSFCLARPHNTLTRRGSSGYAGDFRAGVRPSFGVAWPQNPLNRRWSTDGCTHSFKYQTAFKYPVVAPFAVCSLQRARSNNRCGAAPGFQLYPVVAPLAQCSLKRVLAAQVPRSKKHPWTPRTPWTPSTRGPRRPVDPVDPVDPVEPSTSSRVHGSTGPRFHGSTVPLVHGSTGPRVPDGSTGPENPLAAPGFQKYEGRAGNI